MPKPTKTKPEVPEVKPSAEVKSSIEVKTATPKKETKPKVPKVAPVLNLETAPTPVTVPVSVPVPVVPSLDASVTAVDHVDIDVTDLTTQSTEFLAKLNQLSSLFASLKTEFRSLEKKWSRELKTANKSHAKRKRKSGNRQPSGFVKPTKISDELANFLEKPVGSEMARTDVTREINTYIRAHKLQDKDNGRKINPDPKLAELLKLNKTDELTYFNLQRYMSPHFYKAEKLVVA
jgi:upstream activation factor subunit UAF30